jgi:DNA-binding HxlR family transcriptional regulator
MHSGVNVPDGGDQVVIPAGEASLYGQFCPVAMAAEVLATRWTLVVLSEMLSGSTRFNEIRRGLPRMSSALLSKRLRELEKARVILHEDGAYRLTPSGEELAPLVRGLGRWALRWVSPECTLANLDARLLMWNLRRNDVDLLVAADLKAMTSAWMGLSDFPTELRAKRIELHGDAALSSSFTRWIGRSGLACDATP